jgi:hypothetical protein
MALAVDQDEKSLIDYKLTTAPRNRPKFTEMDRTEN